MKKRFDEKMERGCEGEMAGWCRGLREVVRGRRLGDEENLQDAGNAESVCCPARKNGYSFSNVPDAHARFPAKRMAGMRGTGYGSGVGGSGGGSGRTK